MKTKSVSSRGLRMILLLALPATAVALVLVVAGGGAQEREKERAARSLGKLRERYAAVKTAHVSASVKLAVYGKEFRAGTGTFEYWVEDERYRVRSRTDRQLGLKADFDVAYDGARFYLLDRSQGLLSYREKDEPRSMTSLPNPLFLPVDYLSGDDDDCPLCALRLSDFKAESLRWSSRAAALEVRSHGRDHATGETASEVEMLGGRVNNRPFKLRVRMSEQGDGSARPTQIDRVGTDGRVMASITFRDFAASQLGPFPRLIVVKAFGDDGNLALQAEFTVKTLEVNAPLDRSLFTISFDEAEAVWDSDGKRFVKEKGTGTKRP